MATDSESGSSSWRKWLRSGGSERTPWYESRKLRSRRYTLMDADGCLVKLVLDRTPCYYCRNHPAAEYTLVEIRSNCRTVPSDEHHGFISEIICK
jgi:hypothetical protein